MTQDVTTPVQIEAGRAERDGCGCGPEVIRCVHRDGRVVLRWVRPGTDLPDGWRDKGAVSSDRDEAEAEWLEHQAELLDRGEPS